MLLRSPQSGARRRGVSLVLVTVSIVAVLSVLALSLEGGLLLSERRHAQATADAASMAAAADFYWNWYTNFGTDPAGTRPARTGTRTMALTPRSRSTSRRRAALTPARRRTRK
jgi:Tfp pilus assembly protein PilE